MDNIKEKVDRFLEKYGMLPANVDLDENCGKFISEMEKGLSGSDSSLMMLPTYISMGDDVMINTPVISIDAGGTNLRVAVIHLDENRKMVIEEFKLYPMPGTQGEITKDEFFDTLAGYIEPVFNKGSRISFCFSYPAEILPSKDGRIIKLSKEVKVKGSEGELIGKGLLDALKKRGCTDYKEIIVLNDTVATLLAGKAALPDRVFDDYIGFILGTGTNICYVENTSNIKKAKGLPEGRMLINTESGAYKKVDRNVFDLELDATTLNPGDFAFEKAISGAYQAGLLMTILKKAISDGLFSKEAAEALKSIKKLESKEIDDFLYYPYGANALASCCAKSGDESDKQTLFYIIDAIFERAAKYVAFSLTAIMEKTGRGRNPCSPICITADGSTFYKSKLFRTKLDYYIKSYTNEVKGIYCEFVKVDNGTLAGTAIAGLLN